MILFLMQRYSLTFLQSNPVEWCLNKFWTLIYLVGVFWSVYLCHKILLGFWKDRKTVKADGVANVTGNYISEIQYLSHLNPMFTLGKGKMTGNHTFSLYVCHTKL